MESITQDNGQAIMHMHCGPFTCNHRGVHFPPAYNQTTQRTHIYEMRDCRCHARATRRARGCLHEPLIEVPEIERNAVASWKVHHRRMVNHCVSSSAYYCDESIVAVSRMRQGNFQPRTLPKQRLLGWALPVAASCNVTGQRPRVCSHSIV